MNRYLTVNKKIECYYSLFTPTFSELTSIEKSAFSNSRLEKLFLPQNLKSLKESWSYLTLKLSDIEISPMNENFSLFNSKIVLRKIIENSNFFNVLQFACRDIVSVTIPSSIERIDSFAFHGCMNLETIEIKEDSKLQIIGNYAFTYAIKSISILFHVKKIGECAFFNCTKLKLVQFNSKSELKIIDNEVFFYSSIEKIVIPLNVNQIGDHIFNFCQNLKDVVFDKNCKLDSINNETFAHFSLIKVFIPDYINQICERAFTRCNNLKLVDFSDNSK